MSKFKNITVDDYTSPCPIVANVDTKIDQIIAMMNDHDFRHIPVMSQNRIAGIISQRDIINLMGKDYDNGLFASDIMTQNPYRVLESTPIEEVAFHMSENKIGCALVLDPNQELVGIFTTTDALNALVEVVRGEA